MQASQYKPDPLAKTFAGKVRDLLPLTRGGGGLNTYADSIRAMWMIGKVVDGLVPDKRRQEEAVYERLGAAIGHRGAWVFRTRDFFLKYTKPEMERLLRRAANVSFSHVIALMALERGPARDRIEVELGKRDFTVVQLRLFVRGKLDAPREYGGRTVKVPADMAVGLRDVLLSIESVSRRWSTWRPYLVSKEEYKRKDVKELLKSIAQAASQLSNSVKSIVRKG